MEEDNVFELLQRYRRDRHVLLNYMLSGNLIKKVILPPGAVSLDDVDIDQVSVDYVLSCVKKGDMLDLSEAIRAYYDSLDYPPVATTGSGDEFYLVTHPEYSGSAPMRLAPPIPDATTNVVPTPILSLAPIVSNISKSESFHSEKEDELSIDDIDDFGDEEADSVSVRRRQSNDASDLSLGLPLFETGVADDDLRETAYEILVASAGAAGGLIVPTKEKKKEKKSRLLKKLARSKSGNIAPHTYHESGAVGLLEIMRAQLEIPEAMDIRTKQGLLNALSLKVGKRMDNLLVPLELLSCVSRTEFSDKKAYLRWQKRQLNILEEGLIYHPVVGFGQSERKANELKILLRKIEDSESLAPSAGEIQRTDCLRSLREIATSLAERPARGDLTGEVCHWADGYHLNVKLYERMLSSVFDVLDEGKLMEEVEEILELLKSTWKLLGITETMHYTCYAWVLFRQFVVTGEQSLLRIVIEQLRRIPLKEQRSSQERLHLQGLHCVVKSENGSQDLNFLQSFLLPIQKWADKKLGDYHLNFSEGPDIMSDIVRVAMMTRRILLEETEDVMISIEQDQIDVYICSSIKAAFGRITQCVDARADTTHEHMLASLAEETKKLLKKDSTIFMPILSHWYQQAPAVSAALLHKLYGHKLKPFLDRAEHLTEDTVSVLPAAESLEQYVLMVIASACGEETADIYCKKNLSLYQVENKSGTLVSRWVNSQLGRIIEWVERAIQLEDWDPISMQQRYGSSIVEVFRIIEETVDQFFALKVPMRIGELNSLCRGIDNAFQVYTRHVGEKIVNKEDVIPPVPVLTRYSKESVIKSFVKKEAVSFKLTDERSSSKINELSVQKLCVRMNTLHYAITQLNRLEDSINERWTRKRHENFNIKPTTDEKMRSSVSLQKNTFDGSRADINAAISRICEFTGIKVIFWDLREPFIDNLYRHSVSQSRLESLIDALDVVLNQLCDVIVEPLRDRIVTGLLQASLDGLLRVILDGGSSRIFFPADAKLLEDDLEILKVLCPFLFRHYMRHLLYFFSRVELLEFFISGGDGLPRGTVENLVARARPVIKLIGLETRVLIDDLKEVSQGGRGRLGADSKTLLHVLCHRNDTEASQFLKKQYKIPKSVA